MNTFDDELRWAQAHPPEPMCRCGHPTEAHDAAECWWDLTVDAESWNPVKQCPCA